MPRKCILKIRNYLWLKTISSIEKYFVGNNSPGASQIVDLCLTLKEGLKYAV